MPSASCSTFATGARQFVVQEAFEMMWCALRVVDVVEVDAERDRDVRVLGRRRDDDLAGAGLEMLRGVVAGAEAPGRLDHDVDAELAPGQARRDRARDGVGDARAVDEDRSVDDLDVAGEAAVDGVVLEQVGEHRRVGDIVDRDATRCRPRCSRGARNAARPVRPKPLMATRTVMCVSLDRAFTRA